MEAGNIPSIYYDITMAIAAMVVVLLIVSKNTKMRRRRFPPSGPLSLPIVGHLYLMKLPLHRSLAEIAARYGPILLLRFGSRPVLVISSASLAEECLTSANDVVFANRPPTSVTKYLMIDNDKITNNMTNAPHGPQWRNLRRIAASHILSSACIAKMSVVRTAEVQFLLRRLYHSTANVDMRAALTEFMLNTSVQSVAGKRLYGDEGPRFLRMMHNMFEIISGPSNVEDYLPFVRWLGLNGGMKKLTSLMSEMDVMVQDIVDERRKTREVADEKSKPLVDVLLESQQAEPDYYTNEMIGGMILELLMAGTDTVAGTLEWAMTMLLMHPWVMKKIRDEIQLHVGPGRLVEDSDLPKLVYLKKAIKETLRLKPIAPLLIPHFSFNDSVIGGFDIPRETMLIVNVHAIHRDPKLWTNPTKFMPERFDVEKGDGFKFMPFGMGRRRCPGENLGMVMLELTLASLIQCFEWEKVEEGEIDLAEGWELNMLKVKPLEAKCKPCSTMISVLSQL